MKQKLEANNQNAPTGVLLKLVVRLWRKWCKLQANSLNDEEEQWELRCLARRKLAVWEEINRQEIIEEATRRRSKQMCESTPSINSCSPVNNNPKEDAFYEKAEATVAQSNDKLSESARENP